MASAGRPARTASSCGSRARRAGRWSARASPRSPAPASTASTARRRARSRSARRSATPASASPATARPRATGGFRACPSSIRARQLPRLSRHRPAAAARRDRAQRRRGGAAGRVRHPVPGRFAAPADPRAAHAAECDHRLRRDDRGPVYGPGRRPAIAASAAEIMAQARGLLGAVDDLDTAARLESAPLRASTRARSTPSPCLCRLHDILRAGRGRARLARSRSRSPPACRRLGVEPGAAERMFARLLAGTIGLAGEGETITCALTLAPRERPRHAPPRHRPAARRSRASAKASLLDPGYSPDGDWPGAPALGLGFALAAGPQPRRGGGRRAGDRARTRFALDLPAAAATPRRRRARARSEPDRLRSKRRWRFGVGRESGSHHMSRPMIHVSG